MRGDLIYLDNAATSWPKPPGVGRAISDFLEHKAGNPGRGGHRLARDAAAVAEEARERLAGFIHAPCSRRVVLTHGCTDAVNLAIHGVLRGALRACCDRKPHVVVTSIDHNAVLRTAHCYAADGLIDMTLVECDERAWVDPAAVENACNDRTELVCVSHASNAAGTIQDVRAIGAAARRVAPEALLLVDAAQTVGHLDVDVERDGIDLLAIAGHKGLRGPTGTGALYVSPRAYPDAGQRRVFCQRRGGTGMTGLGLEMPDELPDALEAGTANVAGFAGLIAAMDAHDPGAHEREMRATGRILDGLRSIEGVRVFGMPGIEGRTPAVLFNIGRCGARDVAEALDRDHGICVRGGIHCAPLVHRSLDTGEQGAVRASPGPETSDADIDALLGAVGELASAGTTAARAR